jgi:hypothetical protein
MLSASTTRALRDFGTVHHNTIVAALQTPPSNSEQPRRGSSVPSFELAHNVTGFLYGQGRRRSVYKLPLPSIPRSDRRPTLTSEVRGQNNLDMLTATLNVQFLHFDFSWNALRVPAAEALIRSIGHMRRLSSLCLGWDRLWSASASIGTAQAVQAPYLDPAQLPVGSGRGWVSRWASFSLPSNQGPLAPTRQTGCLHAPGPGSISLTILCAHVQARAWSALYAPFELACRTFKQQSQHWLQIVCTVDSKTTESDVESTQGDAGRCSVYLTIYIPRLDARLLPV